MAASVVEEVVATPAAVEAPSLPAEETTRAVAEAEAVSTTPSVEETVYTAENNTREENENAQQSTLSEGEDANINYEAAAAVANEEETHRGRKI